MSGLNLLVSYGDSGDESDGSNEDAAPRVSPVKPAQAQKRPLASSFLSESDTLGGPLPKASTMFSSVKSGSSGKVKIFVPKLDDVDEDDDRAAARKPASSAESGGAAKPRCALFSVLPPPKVHASLIPPSVTGRRRAIATEDVEWGAKSRPAAAAASNRPVQSSSSAASKPDNKKDTEKLPSNMAKQSSSELYSSDEDDGPNFFSIDDESSSLKSKTVFDYGTEIGPARPKAADIPSSQDNEFSGIFGPSPNGQNLKAASSVNYKQARIDVVEDDVADDYINEDEDDDEDDDDGDGDEGYQQWLAARRSSDAVGASSSIDAGELRKMQGRHNKGEMVNIVECNADDLLDPAAYAKQKAMDEIKAQLQGPNNMMQPRGRAKSRHQITYLAWLAKERETELKEFWSQSKMNKNQAKLKYGF